jgi:uncharacterized protein YeaO (DUF488 family)
MIKTKRAYDAPAKEDGFRILVDRLWPRGLSKKDVKVDLWMKEIAPSAELRAWFKHDPEKWQEFRKRYAAELSKSKELLRQMRMIEKEKRTITLVYGARDEEHNDAVVLREILRGRK